ncbi:transposase [Rugamonas sp. CCM 8940]|uniref:transposase n=1 Tax=Rugamonas sp. CCM 8940 TaxID=2765359 RepID=UPI00351BFED5
MKCIRTSDGRKLDHHALQVMRQQSINESTVDVAVFQELLKRLLVGACKPVFVVDVHSIHKAKLVKQYVDSLDGALKLFYLPPYSPYLNPDKQVWAYVKRQVSKQFVQDKDGMKRLALGALRRIQKLPTMVKSFLQQQECRYAI